MANPGVSGSQIPPGEDFAQRQIADIRRELRELGPSIAKSFQPVIDRLDAADVAMAARVADIAANVASINALLTQVVKPQSIYSSASNFALTTTPTTLKTVTVTVPAGFTSAVVTVLARVFAINPNTTGGPAGTGLDYLFCHPTVAGVSGAEMPLVATGSQGSAMNVSPLATVLTGLTPGGTFTVTVNASTDYLSWSAYTNNVAEISGTILWLV
jgi:hypothetical protein